MLSKFGKVTVSICISRKIGELIGGSVPSSSQSKQYGY